jgi:hypothetical protein
MSSLLHPVGPETARTYWVRRVLVVAAGVLALAVVIALGGAGSAQQQAVPSVSTPTIATGPASADAVPQSPGLVSSSPDPTTSADSPMSPSSTASTHPSGRSSSAGATAAPQPAELTGCQPSQLRATLRGKQSLAATDDNTFTLSLINGGPSRCTVEVAAENFELKIYSGTDRIWTTRHCSSAVKRIKKTVRSEDAVEWKMTWNGRRSAKDCKNSPAIPRAGTYFATAQLTGAKPVQLRMTIKG